MKKEKWLTGFKLLEKRDGRLCSWFCSAMSVNYSTHHETKPKRRWGPLAVFSSLEYAKNVGADCNRPIYRCRYVKSRKTHLFTACGSERFYFPAGTVLASKVKLTRRVA